MLPLFSKVGCNFHEQLKNTVKKISALSDFFLFLFLIQFLTRNEIYFIKANLKLIKLWLIEKRMDMNINYITAYQTDTIFQTIFDFCTATLISRVASKSSSSSLPNGIILMMKQMLISLTQNHPCLLKARGKKQREAVAVISKLNS